MVGSASYQKNLIQLAVDRVAKHGRWVNGPEVREFESAMAGFIGTNHAIGCNSGTDALVLAIKSLGLGPGSKIAVPAFSFQATAAAVCLAGAAPVFADIKESDFGIDVETIKTRVDAVIGVDMFGIPADWESINSFADSDRIPSIEDAAQAVGASSGFKKCGALAEIGCTSFYPSKPLAGIGDGGMVFTDNTETALKIRSIANHGRKWSQFVAETPGMNSRLDSFQAAVLAGRLQFFEEEIEQRRAQASFYYKRFRSARWHENSVWAWFPVLYPDREKREDALAEHGEYGAKVIYPEPLNRMPAFNQYGTACPVAESVCNRILAFPIKHSWEL